MTWGSGPSLERVGPELRTGRPGCVPAPSCVLRQAGAEPTGLEMVGGGCSALRSSAVRASGTCGAEGSGCIRQLGPYLTASRTLSSWVKVPPACPALASSLCPRCPAWVHRPRQAADNSPGRRGAKRGGPRHGEGARGAGRGAGVRWATVSLSGSLSCCSCFPQLDL